MRDSITNIQSNLSFREVIIGLKDMGFVTDVDSPHTLVLRNVNFPFYRLVVPRDEEISVELLKLYARDLNMDFVKFYLKMK